jgi:hypothetical protein
MYVDRVSTSAQLNQAALPDLTTTEATKADAAMDDIPGVNYVHVAGDMTREGAHRSHAFRAIDTFGVVTMTSAVTRHGKRQPAIWPTDHAGEIGWNRDALQPGRVLGLPNPLADRSHLARYEELVSRCDPTAQRR